VGDDKYVYKVVDARPCGRRSRSRAPRRPRRGGSASPPRNVVVGRVIKLREAPRCGGQQARARRAAGRLNTSAPGTKG